MAAPSGEVTLLFTDIEGSTRLWDSRPDAMATALRRHDVILAAVIDAHRGHVFKTVGDAFCAAFASAADAVVAAVEIQRALAAEDWPPDLVIRVRMGLHTGNCEERDDDYFGPNVNRTARLEAVAHGGQILLSASTTALLAVDPLPGVTLVDLGEHRLKDLARPERVAQVVVPGLASEFPPLRSLSNPALRHNLPQVASSFVGRREELSRLRDLLGTTRLVTLTGPGGAGKTRLALQAGAEDLDGSADGVWFCDLSLVAHPDGIVREVATVLGVPDLPGRDLLDAVTASLVTRRLLLVLDNCEHLLADAAAVVDRLLARCPDVGILATSREPLGVPGEHVLRVPPLGLPAGGPGADSRAAVLSSDATTLFVDRARAHDAGFVLDDAAAGRVAAICRGLDGLPLAIELATARLRTMRLEDLENRLEDHLRLLRRSGGPADGGRQQTITALIDWSHRLLDDTEQLVFARLSVFAGPFELAAGVAVAAGDLDDAEVEDAIFSLVDKSLLVPEPSVPVTRYRYLESIRQYAAAHLEAAGRSEVDGARGRLVAWYSRLAAEAESLLFGAEEVEWLQRLDQERPNLLVAFEHAAAGLGVDDGGLAMGGALYLYWLEEDEALGVEVLERVLALDLAGVDGAVRARATWVLAEMCEHVGRIDRAAELADDAFAAAVAVGGWQVAAQARKVAALCAVVRYGRDGPRPAVAGMEEARQLARRSGDPLTEAFVVHDSGIVQFELGDLDGARVSFGDALDRFVRLESGLGVAMAAMNLGNVAEAEGDLEEAHERFTEAFDRLRRMNRHQAGPRVGIAALNLANVLARRGAPEEAFGYLAIGVANAQAFPLWFALLSSALVARAAGHLEPSAVLHGAAGVHLDGDDASAGEASVRLHRDDLEALRADGSVDVDGLYDTGRRMSPDEALRFASAYVSRHDRPPGDGISPPDADGHPPPTGAGDRP